MLAQPMLQLSGRGGSGPGAGLLTTMRHWCHGHLDGKSVQARVPPQQEGRHSPTHPPTHQRHLL
jgi:hypothetical protein